jgi:hypothetical protein
MTADVYTTARAALAAGICAIPAATSGTKQPWPDGPRWKDPFMSRLPTVAELDRWFGGDGKYSGLGFVCGTVSGGLEMIELEGRAVEAGLDVELYDRAERFGILDLVERIEDGYVEYTPSGGIHWLYKCSVTSCDKLAYRPGVDPQKPETLAETKGEGGFVIVAPSNGSTHPTGKPWTIARGGIDTIATITPEEREQLLRLFRTFNEMPAPAPRVTRPTPKRSDDDDDRPGDEYNRTRDWSDVLEPHGWTFLYEHAGTGYWRRPGKDRGVSATTNHSGSDTLKVFSTSTVFDTDGTHNKFGAFALLEHGGDFTAAARALGAQSTVHRQRDDEQIGGAGGSAQPSDHAPGTLPESFWNARPALAHVRQAAHSRQVSASAVLHVILARVAAAIPHTLELPATVGGAVPLCYAAALMGPSGVGKSGANRVGTELLPLPTDPADNLPGPIVADQLPLGSGEGLVETLFEWVDEPTADGKKTKKVKKQVRHNAYVYADEGRVLSDIGNRSGSTLLPTICSIWTGATLGQTNAAQERRRIVPAGNYTFGIVIALQTAKAGALLDDVDAGTPQRFAWAYATDPSVPDVEPEWPGALDWQPPAQVVDLQAEGKAKTYRRHQLGLDPVIRAGLLAILDGRLAINLDDWALAKMIKAASDEVRTELVTITGEEATRRNEAAGRMAGARQDVATETVEARRLTRIVDVARKVAEKVHGDKVATVAKVRRNLAATQRPALDDALELALDEGWIVEDQEPGQGGAQRILRPGDRRPS